MLGHIDFRNLRYQGEVHDNLPHGLGILMDYNHLFCIAHWQHGKIVGPSFVVFPDSKIFCGRIRNNQLDGLCCFYLQDKMQAFANYSQSSQQKRNFITVLPFCKLILQIDHREENKPKVSHHQNYNADDGSRERQLTKLFKKRYDLEEHRSWQDFLQLNFIKPYKKKLHFTSGPAKANEYFVGFRNGGLGIRILALDEEDEINRLDGDHIVVTAMGMFSKTYELSGLGKRVNDYQHFRVQTEGDFGQDQINLIKYKRKSRPKEAFKYFLQQLKMSVNFQNTTLNIDYLYELSSLYSKVNIQLVEQTQKIAQVILQNPDESQVVLAEIENKRQRRRTTPRKNQEQSSRVTPEKKIEPDERIVLKMHPKEVQQKDDSISLSEAHKSIYGSIEKKRRNGNVIKRDISQKALRSYEKSPLIQESLPPNKPANPIPPKYEKPYYFEKKNTAYLYQQPAPKTPEKRISNYASFSPSYAQEPTITSFNKRQQSISPPTRGKYQPNPPDKKYLYQTIMDDPSMKYNERSKPTMPIEKKPIAEYKKEIPIQNERVLNRINSRDQSNKTGNGFVYSPIKYQTRQRNYAYQPTTDKYQPPIHEKYKPPVPEKPEPPAYNLNRNSSSITLPRHKTENAQIIDFFNKTLQDDQASNLYERRQKNFTSNWTLADNPNKRKSPGKIRTFKKRGDHSEPFNI